ncbi:hypothetical protein NC651_033562 [Populus alba x Populus x berolinensis]|nr:hypothetical protein NC651_033562 [Populus alba x Populus x berolinensis]
MKDTHKSNSQKQQSTAMAKSASSSSSSMSSLVYSLPQKPPLKKSGSYGSSKQNNQCSSGLSDRQKPCRED